MIQEEGFMRDNTSQKQEYVGYSLSKNSLLQKNSEATTIHYVNWKTSVLQHCKWAFNKNLK